MFTLSIIFGAVFTMIIASIEPIFNIIRKEISRNWSKVILISLFISFGLSVTFAILAHNEEREELINMSIKDKEEAIQSAYLIQDHPLPRIIVNGQYIFIKLGGRKDNNSSTTIFAYDKRKLDVSLSNLAPISFGSNEKGSILLNCIIRDRYGNIKTTIRDSKLINQAGSNYDLNFDEDAYEIVDENKKTVLQIIIDSTQADSIQKVPCYRL